MKERTALEGLKDRIIEALGENLVCIFLTGSRIRGEERKDSDYDLAIIVSRIDEKVLSKLRSVFLGLTNYSVYVLDSSDLKTLPRAQFLQFMHSRILHGDFEYPLPSEADIESYVNGIRRDCLDRMRHYLVLPHPREKLAKALLPALKSAYLSLSYLIYKETRKFPKTRKDTITAMKKRKYGKLGISLMEILEDWDSCKEKHLANPVPLLLQIEAFFRTLLI